MLGDLVIFTLQAHAVYCLLLFTIIMPSLWATDKIKETLISRSLGWFVWKGVDREQWMKATVEQIEDLSNKETPENLTEVHLSLSFSFPIQNPFQRVQNWFVNHGAKHARSAGLGELSSSRSKTPKDFGSKGWTGCRVACIQYRDLYECGLAKARMAGHDNLLLYWPAEKFLWESLMAEQQADCEFLVERLKNGREVDEELQRMCVQFSYHISFSYMLY